MNRWLVAASVLVLGGWEPLWRSDPDVEAGNQAYAEQKYDEALKAYQRAEDSGVDGAGLAYDRGTAMIGKASTLPEGLDRDATYADAIRELGKAAASPDLKLRAKAHYNRGNVLMKQQKLDEAIEAYKDALRADTRLDVARMNLELALKHRERKQQQQQQGGQGGQGQQGGGQGQQGQQGQGGGGGGGQNQGGGGGGGGDPQPQSGDQTVDPDQQQGSGGGDQQQGGGDQQPQPPQGQGGGGGDQQQQPPQGQGGGGDQQQQQQQGGSGSGSGSGQDDPSQAQGGGGGGGGGSSPTGPSMTQPRTQPSEADDGQTPDTPLAGKLEKLEEESRDQRREHIRRRHGGALRLDDGEDW